MIDILISILESSKSVARIATHSSYIVREAPAHRVNIIEIKNRQVDTGNPRLQTFGSNVDAISRFVFSDYALGHHYQEKLRIWVRNLPDGTSIDDVIRDYGEILNQESLGLVRKFLSGASV